MDGTEHHVDDAQVDHWLLAIVLNLNYIKLSHCFLLNFEFALYQYLIRTLLLDVFTDYECSLLYISLII